MFNERSRGPSFIYSKISLFKFCHFDGCIMTQFFLKSWMSFFMNIICIFLVTDELFSVVFSCCNFFLYILQLH